MGEEKHGEAGGSWKRWVSSPEICHRVDLADSSGLRLTLLFLRLIFRGGLSSLFMDSWH